jgi:ABC-2 type transport system permease protein
MKVLSIAGVSLRRMLRNRSNIFFVFVFPLLLIFMLGTAFGGGYQPRLGVVDQGGGPLAERVVTELGRLDGVEVRGVTSEAGLRRAVERGELQAGLVIPAAYDDAVRSGTGQAVLRYVARPDPGAQQVGISVRAAVARQAALARAARFAARERGDPIDAALAGAQAAAPRIPGVRVEVATTGRALFPADLGRYDVGAPAQLLLFVFMTSLVGSVALIEVRRLGVTRRILATPTRPRTVLAGEALGRLAVGLVQGAFIIAGSALLFGVNWGDPLAAGALLVAFALVGSGAAMTLGALLRTEQQAGAIGSLVGMGFGALGGSMAPLELFSAGMRTAAHVTPHAWANEAYAELVRHDAGLVDIAPQLGVLTAYAAALFAVGAWCLRKSLIR